MAKPHAPADGACVGPSGDAVLRAGATLSPAAAGAASAGLGLAGGLALAADGAGLFGGDGDGAGFTGASGNAADPATGIPVAPGSTARIQPAAVRPGGVPVADGGAPATFAASPVPLMSLGVQAVPEPASVLLFAAAVAALLLVRRFRAG